MSAPELRPGLILHAPGCSTERPCSGCEIDLALTTAPTVLPARPVRYWVSCSLCYFSWESDHVGDCPRCRGTARVRDGGR